MPSQAGANDGYRFSARERDAAFAALRWALRWPRRLCNFDVSCLPGGAEVTGPLPSLFAAGILRDGHLAWNLALRFPDRGAAIAPLIGAPRLGTAEGGTNMVYLDDIVRLPIRIDVAASAAIWRASARRWCRGLLAMRSAGSAYGAEAHAGKPEAVTYRV